MTNFLPRIFSPRINLKMQLCDIFFANIQSESQEGALPILTLSNIIVTLPNFQFLSNINGLFFH